MKSTLSPVILKSVMDKDELDVEKRLQDNITGGKLSFKDMSQNFYQIL